MNDEFLKKIHPLVNSPGWDMFMVYIANQKVEVNNNLETCPPESLRKLQGKVEVYKELLTLRELVNKVMSVK